MLTSSENSEDLNLLRDLVEDGRVASDDRPHLSSCSRDAGGDPVREREPRPRRRSSSPCDDDDEARPGRIAPTSCGIETEPALTPAVADAVATRRVQARRVSGGRGARGARANCRRRTAARASVRARPARRRSRRRTRSACSSVVMSGGRIFSTFWWSPATWREDPVVAEQRHDDHLREQAGAHRLEQRPLRAQAHRLAAG